ncbi:MAG TPA: arginine deiminase family protein [Gemmatimonadales bacterium]
MKSPRVAHGGQQGLASSWKALNYPAEPRYDAAVKQHEQFLALLRGAGAEIHQLPAAENTGPDSVYTHDPVIVTSRGAIGCRMGKSAREAEPAAALHWLESIDIPALGHIVAPGQLEGGDVVWLDGRTVAVGEGYRTNAAGIRQFRDLLGDLVDEVINVPLPHWTGPADCLHLMSLISPVATDLAVVYSRLLPVPFRQRLVDRGIELVEVPDEEYSLMACNVLAVAPRQAIMLAGSPVTEAGLKSAGCEVMSFEGSDLCLLGGGGPTCLTRPLLRL